MQNLVDHGLQPIVGNYFRNAAQSFTVLDFLSARSERQKIAERYRSAGLAESRLIRSQAERQATEILAQAQAEAERIKGAGEADALRILNEAHAEDPAFYETLQAMDAATVIASEPQLRFWIKRYAVLPMPNSCTDSMTLATGILRAPVKS